MERKRGDTATNIIMFFTAMIAVLLGFWWVAKSYYPFHQDLARIDQELVKLQLEFGAGCNSPFYDSKINPAVDKGLLVIRDDEICISTSSCNRFDYNSSCGMIPGVVRCRPLICSTEVDQTVDLKEITYLRIRKNATFEVTTQ